ncbi:glycosyltransferase family 2 protein [Patescibacteria group bacterium]|nr:glycosyltransferase family 2 protein [Patescibacteria group bacterium]
MPDYNPPTTSSHSSLRSERAPVYLSVIIPAYNEEERLPETLREIDKYLKTKDYESEIIVVSDGSTDRTVEVVKNLMPEIKNLRLIEFEKKRGKGFGVRQGMLKASGKYRVFTDADNSTSIDQIEKMWPEFESGFDIVIGSRDIKGAVIAVPQTWFRRRLGDIFNLISQVISGLLGIWDTQCGFKGFTKKAAEDIFSKATIDRFAFDVEVLILAKKLGYKFKEIPVVWINDPGSKVKFRSMVEMLIDVFKIRLNFIKNIYKI